MAVMGQCQCGAIRYQVTGDPVYHAMCHCGDCRRSSGAPAMSWALFPREAVAISGEVKAYASSENVERHFCPACGTGLFYINPVVFPGMIDIQSATFDNPEVFPLQIHVQAAEEISWMKTLHELPKFERYPSE